MAFGLHFDPRSYAETVAEEDADLLTARTLLDIRVSKGPPTKENSLQLLMYCLMGHFSGRGIFRTELFSPRFNTVYRLPAVDIHPEAIAAVSHDVIGYL
jgi:hypothetical protein